MERRELQHLIDFLDYPPNVALCKFFSRVFFLSGGRILLPDRTRFYRYPWGLIPLKLKESPMMIDRITGVYEYWKADLLTGIIKGDMTVLDVGAGRGYFSILVSTLLSDEGRTIAFEPDPINYRWLQKARTRNHLDNLELHKNAISNCREQIQMYRGRESGQRSLHPYEGSDETFRVQARSLDEIRDQSSLNRVNIIKMDVEGADVRVLKGAKNTFRRDRPRLLMDVDVREEKKQLKIYRMLKNLNYQIFEINRGFPPIRTEADFLGVRKDIFAKPRTGC